MSVINHSNTHILHANSDVPIYNIFFLMIQLFCLNDSHDNTIKSLSLSDDKIKFEDLVSFSENISPAFLSNGKFVIALHEWHAELHGSAISVIDLQTNDEKSINIEYSEVAMPFKGKLLFQIVVDF